MSEDLRKAQLNALKLFANKLGDFYLAGGTALALFYFQHRVSEDLDFFTQKFSLLEVQKVIEKFKKDTKGKIKLISESLSEKFVKMLIYQFEYKNGRFLKIDFVEDFLKVLKPFKLIDGIKVLSLEDIYLRKIQAVCGTSLKEDVVGMTQLVGARQTAKDLVDLYFLSHTFINLSDFIKHYCEQAKAESIIRWFRTFDRVKTKMELADLNLKKGLDFSAVDRHFKKEIDKIIEREIS